MVCSRQPCGYTIRGAGTGGWHHLVLMWLRCVYLQMPEDGEEGEELTEEDAADVAARKRAAAKAREDAELRKRSQVRSIPFVQVYWLCPAGTSLLLTCQLVQQTAAGELAASCSLFLVGQPPGDPIQNSGTENITKVQGASGGDLTSVGLIVCLQRQRVCDAARASGRRCCSGALPRPVSMAGLPEGRRTEEGRPPPSAREAAEALLYGEVAALLAHDAAKHPLREAKKAGKVRSPAPPHALSARRHQDAAACFLRVLQPGKLLQ